MPNTQTSVPAFTSGQVLTAAQMTEVNTGIPVFATTTTRDAAFGGTGEKTLAEGQFAYIEASNTTQYYDGAAWQTLGGGLTLIKTQTIGSAVSTVTVTDAFNSTYNAYKIIVSGGTASTTVQMRLQLGSTTTGYYFGGPFHQYDGATSGHLFGSNVASWQSGAGSTLQNSLNVELLNPNLANYTFFSTTYGQAVTSSGSGITLSGFLNDTTQYTAFTLFPNTGTITGGIIRVYGYQNS